MSKTWIQTKRESFASTVRYYQFDLDLAEFIAPHIEAAGIDGAPGLDLSVDTSAYDGSTPHVNALVSGDDSDALREQVRKALSVPRMDRTFNADSKRFKWAGKSSLLYKGEPLDVTISSASARGCKIEEVEETITIPAQPERTVTNKRFISRCREAETV
jgi:hypothetical protein